MDAPTPDEVRNALAPLDARHRKIVAGMLLVMIQEPQRVREREWMAQKLTEVAVHAGGFDADTPLDGVRAVQEFLQANADELLAASVLLFQRVGLDLAPRVGEGFGLDDVLRCGLAYMPADDAPQDRSMTRDLGEQPLARLMAEHCLKPADLVAVSAEQITHKMVTRAMKGRRLTANTMGKVQRALNLALDSAHARNELFDYEP